MVFWWIGRGYLALLTTIGAIGGFGALVTFAFGEMVFDQHPWLWGPAMFLAAAATWCVGRRINRRPIRLARGADLKRHLYYNAPNRFVSLPVETWAVPLAGLGLVLSVTGLLPR